MLAAYFFFLLPEAEDLKVVDTGSKGLDDLTVWVGALEGEVRDGGGTLPARARLWSLCGGIISGGRGRDCRGVEVGGDLCGG